MPNKEGLWCPDNCPITGLAFFMWLSHPDLGYVPTYGGPFDSYTLATVGEDGDIRSERYDHDEGDWVEGGEPMRASRKLTEAIDNYTPAVPGEGEHQAALQRVGTALGLLAGADLHRECVPAIEALMARSGAQQAEPVYQIWYTDNDGSWWDVTKEAWDAHPTGFRRIVYTAITDVRADVLHFSENASVWKIQDPHTDDTWFTEAKLQALHEARAGKTVTGFGNAIAAPAPSAPAGWRELLTGLIEIVEARNSQGGGLRLNAEGQRRIDAAKSLLAAPAPSASPAAPLEAKFRQLSEAAEKSRGATDNPYAERIYLGMREAYDTAAYEASRAAASPIALTDERITEVWAGVNAQAMAGRSLLHVFARALLAASPAAQTAPRFPRFTLSHGAPTVDAWMREYGITADGHQYGLLLNLAVRAMNASASTVQGEDASDAARYRAMKTSAASGSIGLWSAEGPKVILAASDSGEWDAVIDAMSTSKETSNG